MIVKDQGLSVKWLIYYLKKKNISLLVKLMMN